MEDLPDKKLLRISEAAAYFNVSERTIRRWIKKGCLEAKKKAGTVRITRESILDWSFDSNKK